MGGKISLKEDRPGSCINEAAALTDVDPSDPYLETVKKKLRNVPECKNMGNNELHELAECLSIKKKFKERYFDPLLRRADQAVLMTMEEAETFAGGNVPNELTTTDSQERMETGLSRVRNLKVELLLFELRDEQQKREITRFFHKYVHQCTYGPFHAALKIGNLVLDWDETSLIIPYRAEAHDMMATSQADVMNRTLVFRGNLHEGGSLGSEVQIPVRGGAESTTAAFTKQINHLLDITEEKVCLLDTLAELMVKFNNKQRYGILSYNCQHFVTEVLSVLGQEAQADHFRGKTREFFDAILVRRGLTGPGAEFNTHTELDDHVRENIGRMTPENLEFCHCHYLLFHAWSRQFNKPAWSCGGDSCQADLVAKRIGL